MFRMWVYCISLIKSHWSDRKEEKDKFLHNKRNQEGNIKNKIFQGISRRWNMSGYITVSKIKQKKLQQRKCKEGREQKEGEEPTGLGEKRQHVWKFPVNCGTENSSWPMFLCPGLQKTWQAHVYSVAKTS